MRACILRYRLRQSWHRGQAGTSAWVLPGQEIKLPRADRGRSRPRKPASHAVISLNCGAWTRPRRARYPVTRRPGGVSCRSPNQRVRAARQYRVTRPCPPASALTVPHTGSARPARAGLAVLQRRSHHHTAPGLQPLPRAGRRSSRLPTTSGPDGLSDWQRSAPQRIQNWDIWNDVKASRSASTVANNRRSGAYFWVVGIALIPAGVTWRDRLSLPTVGFRSFAGTRQLAQPPGSQPGREVPDDHCHPFNCARHDPARLH